MKLNKGKDKKKVDGSYYKRWLELMDRLMVGRQICTSKLVDGLLKERLMNRVSKKRRKLISIKKEEVKSHELKQKKFDMNGFNSELANITKSFSHL